MSPIRTPSGSSFIPPALEDPESGASGIQAVLYWTIGIILASYLVALLTVGRSPGALWIDVPMLAVLAGWATLVGTRRLDQAAAWVGWAGWAAVAGITVITGGTSSPVLLLLLVLISYVERFVDRRATVRLVGTSLLGVFSLGAAEYFDLLPAPLYVHNTVERTILLGSSLVLSALLLAGRWDERSQTLQRLVRSTESLKAVNSVLSSTRADAVTRARQQQVLARLTVHAFPTPRAWPTETMGSWKRSSLAVVPSPSRSSAVVCGGSEGRRALRCGRRVRPSAPRR